MVVVGELRLPVGHETLAGFAHRITFHIGDPADIFKDARDWSYRLSTRLILRKGLPGLCMGEPILFLRSLVGEGGTGFPICKQGQPHFNGVQAGAACRLRN